MTKSSRETRPQAFETPFETTGELRTYFNAKQEIKTSVKQGLCGRLATRWCALLTVLALGIPAWAQGDIYQSGSPDSQTYEDQFSSSCEAGNANNPYAGMDPLACHGVMAPVDSQGNCSLPRLTLLKQEGRMCYYCQALDPPIKGIIIPFDQLRDAGRQGFKCGVDQADPKCMAICVNEGSNPGYTPSPGTSTEPEPSPAKPSPAPSLPEPPLPGGPPEQPAPPANPPQPIQGGTSQTCYPATQEGKLYNQWLTWCQQWKDLFSTYVFSPLDSRWTPTQYSFCYRLTFTIYSNHQFAMQSGQIVDSTPTTNRVLDARTAAQFANEVTTMVKRMQGRAPPFPAGSTLKQATQIDDILISCQRTEVNF